MDVHHVTNSLSIQWKQQTVGKEVAYSMTANKEHMSESTI